MISLANPGTGRRSGRPPLDLETFSGLLHTRFRASASAGARGTDLVLTRLTEEASAAGGECFSLLFVGPLKRPLDQGTYTFAHAALGSFDMFIVPKPADRFGCYYEAVFNRIP
jgi:hypothetical protein